MTKEKKFRGYQAAYTGFYKGQFLRSFPEFIYALYLDKVKKVKFVTEPFALHSKNSKKRKIPDFAYVDPESPDMLQIVEIKANYAAIENTVVDYANYQFMSYYEHLIHPNFAAISSSSKRHWVKKITDVIGIEEFKRLSDEFKKQRSNENRVYTGFPGEKHPQFGTHLSEETKQRSKETKIKNNTYDTHGEKNSNYGNHLSEEAKVRVGAKWYDPEKSEQ